MPLSSAVQCQHMRRVAWMGSNLPISSPYRSTPDAPVTDAERDRLNARLNAAYTAGTLDQEDYQARLTGFSRPSGSESWCRSLRGCHRYRPTRIRRSSGVQGAARRAVRVATAGPFDRRRHRRCGRHPACCHFAGALDLAVQARPTSRPFGWVVEGDQTHRFNAPNTV